MRKSPAVAILICVAVLSAGIIYASTVTSVKTYFLKGDYSKAIEVGEEEVNSARHNSSNNRDQLYYFMGLCYMKEGDYLRAKKSFEFVIDEYPASQHFQDARMGIADISYLEGDYSKASRLYKDLLESSLSRDLIPGLYSRLSLSLSKLDQISQAQEYLLILQREYPESFESIKGNQLFNQGSFYTVQVGAFSDRNNALRLKSKLLNQGYSAYVEELGDGEVLTHRVRVGKLKSRQEAISLQDRLVRQDYPAKIFP